MTCRLIKIIPLFLLIFTLFLLWTSQAQDAEEQNSESNEDSQLWPHPLPYEPNLDEMIGQMLLAGFRGTVIDEQSLIIRDIEQYHLGGVVLFSHDVALGHGPRNIESPIQLKELTATLQTHAMSRLSKLPLFVGIDQEGGRVQRLKTSTGFMETASPAALAVDPNDPLPAMAAGLAIGRQLSENNINLDFAPVLDLNVNPESPAIGKLGRSFGASPAQVTKLASAFTDTLRGEGILSCVKHFPGHGSSRGDSHLGLTDVTDTWTETELQPFAEFIKAGQADMIMTAHLFNSYWDREHPATLSRTVITTMLRGELGYDGVVITDDMNMGAITEQYGLNEAIYLAIEAGCDILLFGNNLTFDPDIVPKAHGIIKELVTSDRVSKARIRESYLRITALKKRMQ